MPNDDFGETTHHNTMTNLEDAIQAGIVTLVGFAIIGAYAALFLAPIGLAYLTTDYLIGMGGTGLQMAVFVVLSLVLSAVSVAVGHAVGMLNFDKATGRVPPRR